MKSRMPLWVLIGACGIAIVASNSFTWVSGLAESVTGELEVTVTGESLPLIGATGLVMIAAALALPLARPILARIIGVLVLVASAFAAVSLALFAYEPLAALDEAARTATGLPWTGDEFSRHASMIIPSAALLVAIGVAAVLVRTPGQGPGRSRFESGTGESEDARGRAMDDWDALGRGEDPSRFDDKLTQSERSHDD